MATTETIEMDMEKNEPVGGGKKTSTRKKMTTRKAQTPATTGATSEAEKFMTAIIQAAANPEIDLDRIDRLYQVASNVKADEAKVAYNRDMALCQGEMPIIEKKHLNNQTGSKYAKVEDILRVIKPIYTKYGFSVTMYPMEAPEGMVKMGCDIAHAAGHEKHFEDTELIDDRGMSGKVNKTQIHGRGSAKTYLERSLLTLAFALEIGFSEDDDGNAAGISEVLYITDDQIKQIEDLITEYDLDRDQVLRFCESGTGTADFSSLKAPDFDRFMRQLKNKASAKQASKQDL